MGTIQVTNLGGKIIEGASWKVGDTSNVTVGEVVRVNLAVKDAKLTKYLAKNQIQECSLEKEDGWHSVTVGLIVEKFTHFLDSTADPIELESMAWAKPLNRGVEAVIAYLLDRESCDQKFLAAVGAKRREGEED